MVTVFSATKYCGKFDNRRGILIVNANLKLEIATYVAVLGAEELLHRKGADAEIDVELEL